MALPNPGLDAVPFTPLTADFLDKMNQNIAALADGSGATLVQANKLYNPYKFSVTHNAALTANSTFVLIPFNTEEFDTSNNISAGVFTAPVTGYYQFNWQAQLDTAPSSLQFLTTLFKNNVRTRDGNTETVNGAAGSVGAAFLKLNAGDTVDIRVYCASPKGVSVISPTPGPIPAFSGYLVSLT